LKENENAATRRKARIENTPAMKKERKKDFSVMKNEKIRFACLCMLKNEGGSGRK